MSQYPCDDVLWMIGKEVLKNREKDTMDYHTNRIDFKNRSNNGQKWGEDCDERPDEFGSRMDFGMMSLETHNTCVARVPHPNKSYKNVMVNKDVLCDPIGVELKMIATEHDPICDLFSHRTDDPIMKPSVVKRLIRFIKTNDDMRWRFFNLLKTAQHTKRRPHPNNFNEYVL